MGRISIRALSMMLLMMTAGCLQAVDGVIEDIDRTIDALEGDYPKLDLPERTDLPPPYRITMPARPSWRICSQQCTTR